MKEWRKRGRKMALPKEEEWAARLKRAVQTVRNFVGSALQRDTPLEVWFADHYEGWLAGNNAMVNRATCATRAGGLAREQHGNLGHRATSEPGAGGRTADKGDKGGGGGQQHRSQV